MPNLPYNSWSSSTSLGVKRRCLFLQKDKKGQFWIKDKQILLIKLSFIRKQNKLTHVCHRNCELVVGTESSMRFAEICWTNENVSLMDKRNQ